MWYQNSTGWNYICDYEFNAWYHVRFDYDVDENWYLLTFDDQTWNLTFWSNPSGLNTFGWVSGIPE